MNLSYSHNLLLLMRAIETKNENDFIELCRVCQKYEEEGTSLYCNYFYTFWDRKDEIGLCVVDTKDLRDFVVRLGIQTPIYFGENTDPVMKLSISDLQTMHLCDQKNASESSIDS